MLVDLLKRVVARLVEFKRNNPYTALVVFALVFSRLYECLQRKWRKLHKKSLNDKSILITGGASGIGKLLALKCTQNGARVIVWDINQQGVNDMKDQVYISTVVDITNKRTVEEESKRLLSKLPNNKLDILVNNAGIVSGTTFMNLSEKQIRSTFEVNVISHFWMIQSFLPAMVKESGTGHIVTIASTAGIIGTSHLTDYCSSKFAARGLDHALSRELNRQGLSDKIKLTCVCPYFINTGMFDGTQSSKLWIYPYVLGIRFLDQNEVVNEIYESIEVEEREVILSRQLGRMIVFLPLFPHWIQDLLVINSNDMSTFVGHG